MTNRALPALLIAALLAAVPLAASADPPVNAPTVPLAVDPMRIDQPSVAAALAALQARDGQGSVVTHHEGWTVIAEPQASAQWSFTPPGHAAHPAVARRVITRGADGQVTVHTRSLCEGPAEACAALLAEFERLNDRIVQAARARGRGMRPAAPPGTP